MPDNMTPEQIEATEADVRKLEAEANAIRAMLATGEHLKGTIPFNVIAEIPDSDPPVCPALWNIRHLQTTAGLQNLDSRASTVEQEIAAARSGQNTLEDTISGLIGKVGGISQTLNGIAAPASVQQVMSLDWLYRSNRIVFELFDAGYRQQNHMGVSIIDGTATGEGVSEGTILKGGIMGDDSLDIASTKGLLVGGYYLLTDGVDTRMIRVEEILTENRIRLSPELDRDWEAGATLTGSTFTQRNGNTVLGGVSAKDGGQWISRSINLGTDNGDRAVVVRRTLNDAKARLYFIDSRNPSWVEIQWEHCRSNNLDIPDGFGDYEYIVPMRGDGALRLHIVDGDVDINHIAALGTPTGLGGASNPDNRPPAPTINFPADGATGVSETPSFSIIPVIGEWEAIQFDVKDSLGESVFTDIPTQKGVQYSLPAGLLLAGEEYKFLARVQDKKGRWSDWTTATFTCAPEFKYIKTPTVTAPVDGAGDINAEATLTLTGSAFAVMGGSDSFAAQQWQVLDVFGEVWTSAEITTNGNVTLPADTLQPGWKSYTVQVRHKGAVLGWSEWSNPVTITTKGYTLELATTTKLGGVMLATTAEARAGIDDAKAVTPAGIAAHVAALPKAKAFIKGMILPFSGTFSGIYPIDPATGKGDTGWQLCDGSNGTPNLRDRFIVGAGSTYPAKSSGGAATHTHSFTGNVGATTLTTTQMPSHSHDQSYATSGIQSLSSSGFAVFATQDTTNSIHFVRGGKRTPTSFLGGGGSHTHSLSTVSTSSQSNLPPYYALSYIMYMGG